MIYSYFLWVKKKQLLLGGIFLVSLTKKTTIKIFIQFYFLKENQQKKWNFYCLFLWVLLVLIYRKSKFFERKRVRKRVVGSEYPSAAKKGYPTTLTGKDEKQECRVSGFLGRARISGTWIWVKLVGPGFFLKIMYSRYKYIPDN